MDAKEKSKKRWRRHRHIRNGIIGTAERPRLAIFRSHKHIYCQIVDDTFVDKNGNRSGKTLVSCSTLSPDVKKELGYGGNIAGSKRIGEEIGKLAIEKGITKVTFDRGGFKYHGRVKALAEAAREVGLKF